MELKITEPSKSQKISYEEILMKMGMFVKNGELQLIEKNVEENPQIQYSYIHNKYFKDSLKKDPEIKSPKTMEEYNNMLVDERNQLEKIKEIKSRKLLIPESRIRTNVPNRFSMNNIFNR